MEQEKARAVLLVTCTDERGLVARITGILLNYGCNIVENGEFVDVEAGRFFMRTAFESAGDLALLPREVEVALPDGAAVRLIRPGPKRMVILAGREPHCLGDLLIRCAFQDMNATIAAVVSNHEVLRPLVERFDLPFHLVRNEALARAAHEEAMRGWIDRYEPSYVVMAKYMRILSPPMVAQYAGRLINIHHSFLPAFAGAHPYRQAYERGVKVIGATAHFATEELDEGPIIAQGTLPVRHTQSWRDLARAGRDVEKQVLARALHLVFEDRVFVHGNRTVIFE